MSRTALVTGAGGFIGSHLAAALAAGGWNVRALDLRLRPIEHLGSEIEMLQGDVAAPEITAGALTGVDTVFHLAAAHLDVTVSAPDYERVNVQATRELARKAAGAGVRRFVHCSSVGVYGPLERTPADEQTTCRPRLVYERTKLAGEQALREQAAEDDLAIVILRPVWVYGPGCPRTTKLMNSIRRGRFVVGGRGEKLRHSVYIRDMVRALILAAACPDAVGETVIVGDAQAVTVRRLIDEIARITGGRRPPSVPLPMLAAVATLAEWSFLPFGRQPPLSRRTLTFFLANTAFDISRSRRLLRFEPRYDLPAGLADTWRRIAHGSWLVSLAEYEGLDSGVPVDPGGGDAHERP